jgi:cell division cycle protein 20 (cofactor of APC complex)
MGFCSLQSSNISELKPLYAITDHTSAVKAIDWCPWQNNVLATGGGTNDCQIKTWNIYNGTAYETIKTSSQITGLLWSANHKELLSSHGLPDNKLFIWKYPKLEKLAELNGHTGRILSIALSPNQEKVASLAGDATIRFWECFKGEKKQPVDSTPVSVLRQRQNIR